MESFILLSTQLTKLRCF